MCIRSDTPSSVIADVMEAVTTMQCTDDEHQHAVDDLIRQLCDLRDTLQGFDRSGVAT